MIRIYSEAMSLANKNYIKICEVYIFAIICVHSEAMSSANKNLQDQYESSTVELRQLRSAVGHSNNL